MIGKTERGELKEKVKILIARIDEGEGVEVSKLLLEFQENEKEKVDKIIDEFLSEGEAYEPRPGKVKLI